MRQLLRLSTALFHTKSFPKRGQRKEFAHQKKTDGQMANSEDPDQMPHSAASEPVYKVRMSVPIITSRDITVKFCVRDKN